MTGQQVIRVLFRTWKKNITLHKTECRTHYLHCTTVLTDNKMFESEDENLLHLDAVQQRFQDKTNRASLQTFLGICE